MGAMTAAIVGLGVAGGATSMLGGIMQNQEAKRNASAIQDEAAYNAGVYRQQSGMVEQQKQLKAQQDARAIRFAEGKTTAMAAAKGIEMSGSPIAILIDTVTQMELDKAITSYNYDIEKYSLESKAQATESRGATLAAQYRRGGRDAMIGGFMSGLTTLAGTATFAGMSSGVTKSINLGNSGQSYNSMFGSTRSFGGMPLTI